MATDKDIRVVYDIAGNILFHLLLRFCELHLQEGSFSPNTSPEEQKGGGRFKGIKFFEMQPV